MDTPSSRPVVLCVDDERPVLSALRRALFWEPYDISTFQDPSEALKSAAERPVEVLVADQRMPLMAGTEFIREMLRLSPSTRVIVLTAYPDADLLTECADLAIHRLITKPWDEDDLRRAIRELVNAPPPEVRVHCANQEGAAVREALQVACRQSGACVRIVLLDLPRMNGSVSRLLRELLEVAASERIRVCLVEPSGFAKVFLSVWGGEGSPIVLETPSSNR